MQPATFWHAQVETVQGPFIDDGVLVASGHQLLQHLLFIASVVASELAFGEQRVETGVAVVEHRADRLWCQLGQLHRLRRNAGAYQHVALHHQGHAPDVVAGEVVDPGLGDITAYVDVAVFHGAGNARPSQDVELRRAPDLGGQARHQVIEDALGGLVAVQLHHGHRPAVGNREAQRCGRCQACRGDHP